MSTCELCGFEGASTRKATVHGSLLDCCTKCIDSMGLIIQRKAVKIPESIPDSQVVGKGISGMDIMTKEELELDNCESHKGAINENYGRELLELFSMGTGNYTEKDIKIAGNRAFRRVGI